MFKSKTFKIIAIVVASLIIVAGIVSLSMDAQKKAEMRKTASATNLMTGNQARWEPIGHGRVVDMKSIDFDTKANGLVVVYCTLRNSDSNTYQRVNYGFIKGGDDFYNTIWDKVVYDEYGNKVSDNSSKVLVDAQRCAGDFDDMRMAIGKAVQAGK